MIDQSRACRVFLVLVLTSVMTAFCSAEALAAPPAKNVILMIADGAGFNAFEAASYYQHGALDKQAYERFPVHFGCTTYMLNYVDAEGNTLVAGGAATPKGAVGTKLQGYDPQAMWKSFNYCKGRNNYTIFTVSIGIGRFAPEHAAFVVGRDNQQRLFPRTVGLDPVNDCLNRIVEVDHLLDHASSVSVMVAPVHGTTLDHQKEAVGVFR